MRSITTAIIAVLLAAPLAAESALFVSSAPIRAEVTINGTAYGPAPVLVRGIAPGVYEVTAIKSGYQPATERVEIAAQEVRAVRLRPQPDFFVGSFSAAQTIVGSRVYARQESVFELPSGTYELSADGNDLRLSPVYPREGALQAARLTTVAAGLAALIATVEDLLIRDGRSYFTSYLPSPATFAVLTVTAGAAGFWIGLAADKRAYEQRMAVNRFTGMLTHAEAERLYLEGDAALEAGSLSRALGGYSRVVADGGDSEYLPSALYKSAQIYSVSGDLEFAAQLLEILVTELPEADLYDRALKLLGDLYTTLGRYDEAIDRLGRMLFYDDLFDREDIAVQVEEITELREAQR